MPLIWRLSFIQELSCFLLTICKITWFFECFDINIHNKRAPEEDYMKDIDEGVADDAIIFYNRQIYSNSG